MVRRHLVGRVVAVDSVHVRRETLTVHVSAEAKFAVGSIVYVFEPPETVAACDPLDACTDRVPAAGDVFTGSLNVIDTFASRATSRRARVRGVDETDGA